MNEVVQRKNLGTPNQQYKYKYCTNKKNKYISYVENKQKVLPECLISSNGNSYFKNTKDNFWLYIMWVCEL